MLLVDRQISRIGFQVELDRLSDVWKSFVSSSSLRPAALESRAMGHDPTILTLFKNDAEIHGYHSSLGRPKR
jgi:hypothetical protein